MSRFDLNFMPGSEPGKDRAIAHLEKPSDVAALRVTDEDYVAVEQTAAVPVAPAPLQLVRGPRGGYICPEDPGEAATGRPRGGIDPSEGHILRALAAKRVVLEIGTGLGISTGFMAETARHVDTVDPDPWVHEKIWPRLPGNVSRHERLEGAPLWTAPTLIFIDGDHREEAVTADLMYALTALGQHGIIVLHDMDLVGEAAGKVAEENGLTVLTLDTPFRMGVIVR